MSEPQPLLEVRDLVTGYGKKQIVNGVSLEVPRGEIVALIGHNGAGKSTLLKAVFGLLPVWSGRILFDGEPLPSSETRDLLRVGVSYLPQGNRVFATLTVAESLELASQMAQRPAEARERALELFPALASRLAQRAGTLSGGEQQMLALASALIPSPRLLLLDEPSLGLAPPRVREAFAQLREITTQLGVSVLMVEQKVRQALKVAQCVVVLRTGRVSFAGSAAELDHEAVLRQVYL